MGTKGHSVGSINVEHVLPEETPELGTSLLYIEGTLKSDE
jgi:hypothetical protein